MRRVLEWHDSVLVGAAPLTDDIRLLDLAPQQRWVPAAPGSHIGVGVEIDGRPETRFYSLVAPAVQGRYRIAVKRLAESRGGSRYLHGLAVGARVRISEPGNDFPLAPDRPFYLLAAGGIGITPLTTMAAALRERGAAFRLLYAARSEADLAFADTLAASLGERLRLNLDERGERIDFAAEIARLPDGAELYVCGPIGMLEAAKRAWAEAGRPIDGLRFETFGNSGRYATMPFTVRIPRLGRELTVGAEETLLEALERAGVGMIYDCRRGECGLCAVRILAAESPIDHRDVFFSDAQRLAATHLCTCVSRLPGGVLTIETADR